MGTGSDGLCLAVCLILCIISHVSSSDISFTSSPSSIHPLETEELTLRCSLKESAIGESQTVNNVTSNTSRPDVISDSAGDDVISDSAGNDTSFIQSIVLTKSGVPVATVAGRFGAKVFDNTTGVKVSGQVQGTGDDHGYLEISWEHPDLSQVGTYQCAITGTEPSGHVQTLVQTLDVVESEVWRNDFIANMQKMKITNNKQADDIDALSSNNSALNIQITELKTSNKDLNMLVNGLKASNTDLKVQVKGLKASNDYLKVQVNELKTFNADIKAKINQNTAANTDLKSKFDKHVSFNAWLGSEATFRKGETVVFNKVFTNIDGVYDVSTGEFTAPFSGTYMFTVHTAGQYDKRTSVCIRKSDSIYCHGKAFADENEDNQSGSISIILQLSQGVKITVQSLETSYMRSGSYNSFSGHLLALT